jgi:cytochrome c553
MKKTISFFLIVFLNAGNFSYCKMCHGKKEIDLNTLTKKEIKKKLLQFKTKKSGLMPSIAKKLTKKDMEKILKIYGK